ncbi:uncharacterized protein LOC131946602 isoform X2 [Physella acuta]|uniref:uncharacterized protein LOC131946602 isoform X2 n=1 Tax=Physella acuta TaxID=109671 RepID=UPI0027DE2CD3|nr:uncharacterized protein LOC131946602 isoform X2 [Physella acuta]XP_059163474.1 uncharacterized protein LOC131946602 isoform X2 [Physella acuta]XP_059163475.1 uncharacterized protein LOC131946602 isoform X2 [Physella acuta]
MERILGWRCSILLIWVVSTLATHNKWWACNNECARCVRRVTPMEELIVQFYPGLFSETPPENIYNSPETPGSRMSTINSGSAWISHRTLDGSFNRSVSHGQWDAKNNASLANAPYSQRVTSHPSVPECCKTNVAYDTPPTVTIRGRIYQVVHLLHAYQFIPIGRCATPGAKCPYGECVEQYRAHWVLIYNSSTPAVGPPVSFSAIEVPSHCECINVGRP